VKCEASFTGGASSAFATTGLNKTGSRVV